METTIYEDKARTLIAEMKQLIDMKGITGDNVFEDAGVSKERADQIFQGELPSLSEFLALCQISGISIQLPSVETPNTPM
ncbi:transcriptional regulator [Dyadobacter sp. CY326]|uniref:transcriptional regulator n=1 Tax=Dyadobacter sp. CY326 TaxID=2907300 RepID=UPI001F461C3D|nr:transcriptional regulator [Dyadobacter sp. CY326]MCE7065978.1 transcriptional regulator [Dyadobacter sp. CY326]